MSNATDKIKAKRALQKMFPPGEDPVKTYQNYSEDDYLYILSNLQNHIPFTKNQQNLSLAQFLYAGCLKFDRFTAPSPFVVPTNFSKNFSLFIRALEKVEGGITDNLKVFLLRKIRDDIYKKIDTTPLKKIHTDFTMEYKEKINNIPIPENKEKLTEFENEKEKINSILTGINDLSLKTQIKTRIPYILHQSALNLSFSYKEINSKIQTKPIFTKTNVGFLNVDSAATQHGPSRWQFGFTDVEFEFSALIDCDAYSEPLQALIDHNFPINGWPKCFVLAFKVLLEIAWQLRLNHDGEKSWIPTPSDFEDIEWAISSSSDPVIEWKRKSAPSSLIHAFTPSTKTLNINLGTLSTTKWSVKCRSFAIMYFEMGQLLEAIFWLNVGVEAVFEEGFVKIAEKLENRTLQEELSSPKAFWSQAEDIIIEQFPEMTGKVNWPNTEIHISIFTKLKYLYKNVEMKTKLQEITKKYSKIRSHRNDLFHGRPTTTVTVEDVKTAIECFDWINSNFDIKN